jgi:hypothetical protein
MMQEHGTVESMVTTARKLTLAVDNDVRLSEEDRGRIRDIQVKSEELRALIECLLEAEAAIARGEQHQIEVTPEETAVAV